MSDERYGTMDQERAPHLNRRLAWFVAAALALVITAALYVKLRDQGATPDEKPAGAEHAEEHGAGNEAALSPEALTAAKLEYAEVASRPAGGRMRVTGSVEVNQQQTQQATPLVSGRVEKVYAALGDRVRAGQTLATISSPQIAQMHGKLHEAETKLGLAERELDRVMKAENRAEVLKAKARLDEAEAALKRTKRLIELGAGAGKDLIAAEAAYKTAKAEYEFQRDISLNRQVAEARAAVETARVDVSHIRYEMKALGAPVRENERDDHSHDTSLIALRAPISGSVTERLINAGAGIESGKPLFTIANLETVWVIASAPEAQVGALRVGEPAKVFSSALGDEARSGRITYIAPQLDEETRTAKVRIDLPNPGERLKAGMFTEVEFQSGTGATEYELVAPEAAIQRIGGRTVVFIAEEDEPGHFKARDVEIGATTNGLTRILSGLKEGERVVTKGSFTLKTQLLKGELEEDGH
ncbi:MAG: efflux RND transporter periplasmic adaptor subunit [Blastocatellales bacterium]